MRPVSVGSLPMRARNKSGAAALITIAATRETARMRPSARAGPPARNRLSIPLTAQKSAAARRAPVDPEA